MIEMLLAASLALLSAPAKADPTVELLRAKDQALLDAIAPGDRKVWDDAMADDATYVDENGTILSRADFLKQMEPLPAGASGSIEISSYEAHISGDLATVIHKDNETEHYHGQELHAQYLTSETWTREDDVWKLHLVHTYAILHDPPAISLPADEMKEYAGRYQGGEDLVYEIKWDGKELTGGRAGKEMKPLKVEVRDVLFAPGQPRIRKIFKRDAKGKIIGFVDRRESWDLAWKVAK
jgi:ketosteroid isomerase-like protein